MAYTIGMEFEWDDAKTMPASSVEGFDFAYAVRAFLDPHRIGRPGSAMGLWRGSIQACSA